MKNSRRDFVKTVGFTGMAAMGVPGVSLASRQSEILRVGRGLPFSLTITVFICCLFILILNKDQVEKIKAMIFPAIIGIE